MKRFLSLLIAVLMIFSLSVGVYATDTESSDTVVTPPEETPVTGPVGEFFTGEVVALNKTGEDGALPESQVLWKGEINTKVGDAGADGVTLIYKLDGVDTPVVANCFNIKLNDTQAMWQWNWQATTNTGGICSANLTFEEDGYYFMYINNIPVGGYKFETFKEISIFGSNAGNAMLPDERTNTNENATFQMLGVVANNLTPTVNFYDGDELIVSYTHAYTDITGSIWSAAGRTIGKLLDPAGIFALTELAAPAKAADANGVYTFKGWVDADGNPVDAVYQSMDVYADYEVSDAAIFKDEQGTAIDTILLVDGALPEDAVIPSAPAKAGDGIITFAFAGWSVDGETVVDPLTYEYTGTVVFTALYNQYGVIYENPTPQPIPTDTSKEVNFMTETVPVSYTATGITFVYKVDGVTEDIIADNFLIATKNSASPAWQWDDANYCATGDGTANLMTLKNGYFFVYANVNVNGMNAQKADNVINKFAIYALGNTNYANGGRTPVNNNENATLTMLAVINNNLQPTATFHSEDGSELISYTHKYTDVNAHLNYGTGTAQNNSVVKGSILSVDEVFALTELATPVKEATHNGQVTYEFAGWVDADGNAVDALYYNVDLYPSFRIASDSRPEYEIKFVDEDGTELYSAMVREGDIPVFVGDEPAKAPDKVNSYAFAGWNVDVAPATADATYKATYQATKILYTVTFMNGETEYDKQITGYEGTIELPADPAKESTAQYSYTFAGWVDAEGNEVTIDKVTDNITVYASYTETVNKYTVTFMNGDERYGSFVFEYGKDGKAPEKAPEYNGEKAPYTTYAFAGWVDAEGNAADLKNITGDITVYASYTETKLQATVTFMDGETELEKVTVNCGEKAEPANEPAKETVSFTKYTFKAWVDAEGNEVDLSAVTEDITVYASYTVECEHSFPDVKEGEWYVEAVEWALMNGVMNGEGTNFNPDKATTRAMIVTVLYRLEGSPDVSGVEHPFTDLKEGEWYYDAVLWAYDNGVVNGMTATTFVPTGTLTREQFATILYRYAKEIKGEDVTVSSEANLDAYTDKGEVSDYALDAVLWTNVNGYIGGTSATKLSPKGSATRAQMATILYRYI